MYGSGIEIPKVAFSTITLSKIATGSYFIGFDLDNGGKLSKINNLGNITVIEKDDPPIGFTYEIGDYVSSEGGVIAHRWLSTSAGGSPMSGTVQNYLVVDSQDLSNSAEWASNAILIPDAKSIWGGLSNTISIVTEAPVPNYAAVLCDSSSNGGKTDWYLPAIQELNKLWNNMWEVSQGIERAGGNQFVFNSYWSSTEYDPNSAWAFTFSYGQSAVSFKSATYCVRAVRKFSI
jgi:hypothetical protein